MIIYYKKDHQLKHKTEIVKGLVSYNEKFAGKPFEETAHSYVFDKNQLVGGCIVEVGWNWLFFESVIYNNQDVINELIFSLKKKYHHKIEGFAFETYLETDVKAFEEAGFISNGF